MSAFPFPPYLCRCLSPADLHDLRVQLSLIRAAQSTTIQTLNRMETHMSALSNALAALAAQDSATKAEVDQLLTYAASQSANITALQAAIADLQANGVSADQLAQISAVTADMLSEHDSIVAALPAPTPAPAPVNPPPAPE